jgi:hypothetical protein
VDQAIYVCPLKFVVVEEDKTLWRPTASPLFFPPRAHTIRIVRASARAIPAPPRSDSSEFLLPMASSGIRLPTPCEFVDSCGEFCYYYTSLFFFFPERNKLSFHIQYGVMDSPPPPRTVGCRNHERRRLAATKKPSAQCPSKSASSLSPPVP